MENAQDDVRKGKGGKIGRFLLAKHGVGGSLRGWTGPSGHGLCRRAFALSGILCCRGTPATACGACDMRLIERINGALAAGDASYAHVLLHSLARIYNHTPYQRRAELLARWNKRWPALVTACLGTCSQDGK